SCMSRRRSNTARPSSGVASRQVAGAAPAVLGWRSTDWEDLAMRLLLTLALTLLATPALADPAAWCEMDKRGALFDNCVEAAPYDHVECLPYLGEKYGNCRFHLLAMRSMSHTPVGPIVV